MNINLKQIYGNWDEGYALDRHVISSTPIGYNDYGRMQFDTNRTDAGEALFLLKYRSRWDQAPPLAQAVFAHIVPKFPPIGLIVPMPPSSIRARQPVFEVANELAQLMSLTSWENILTKAPGGASLKNLVTKQDKVNALAGRITVTDAIATQGKWDALLLDDLFDSGASMEAATAALKTYSKVDKVYVAALTWK